MTLDYVLVTAAVVLVLGATARTLGVYRRFRGPRVVMCPTDGRPAAVCADARQAALTALGGAALRLEACSLWPERRHCGQMCLDQVEVTPGPAPIVKVLRRWYEGRKCRLCGGPFTELRWAERPPAMMDPQGRVRSWYEVSPAWIAAGLPVGAYQPVCWRCHVLEDLRREEQPVPARTSA